MQQKIKKLIKPSHIEYLSDMRNLGMIIFVMVALLVTWSGIKVVQTNYDLQKKISVMRQEVELKKLENSNLELRNKYLETDQYLELAARKQYNKALPGEKLLIVPKSVAMAHSIDQEVAKPASADSAKNEGPFYERNFNAWIDFMFKH